MQVVKRSGEKVAADKRKIARCVDRACLELEDVDSELITHEAYAQLFDGISTSEIERATILSARARIAYEPNYSQVAARLLLHSLYREAFGHTVNTRGLNKDYRESFKKNIRSLVEQGRLQGQILTTYDLDELAEALKPERDLQFKYLGVQTLYDRYFLQVEGRRLETPQGFWMRVAMGLCFAEAEPTKAAIDAYELMSTFRYCPGTPTLFNSATVHPQLSSCYLSTVEDSIDGIFDCIHQQARLAKYAGGLGVDWTPIRGLNSTIKGTNGKSQGLVPWLKIWNDTLVAVNQSGKRKGAGVAFLETWHIDVEDFLELRKNTGDERRRCHDMNTSHWVPDFFMDQVRADGDWWLFSPDECPRLHETFGIEFVNEYFKCVDRVQKGELKIYHKVKAKDLWKRMLKAIYETGHPWIAFKDPCNLRYSNQHVGVIHSSNLCQEVVLHTRASTSENLGETAVCVLGSPNLGAHLLPNGSLDKDKLSDTVRRAIRLLDNVMEQNYYPTKEAALSSKQHRPVGLGLMGWSDLLHSLKLSFDSDDAVSLASEIQEFISYHAISTSTKLAKERGTYPSYPGSLWSRGELPINTYHDLMNYRGNTNESGGSFLDWASLREDVREHGMRNSNVMALAPTASISFILGCSQSIEPDPSVLYVYSTLSGEFTMVSEPFAKRMKAIGLWDEDFIRRLQAVDGDVSKFEELPQDIKDEYKVAFDVDQFKLIDAAAARQRFIDQGQSLNLYYRGSSLKELSDIYFHAWESGLKTTYYLRTEGASRVEKSMAQETSPISIYCPTDGSCEACQ